MNKAELIDEVANQTGLTKNVSREAVNSVILAITDSLAREERVTLVGFGSFRIMERKARRGRNPRTGKELRIPAKKVPRFRPGESLREII
jgi:nucleoid DNA-binding protein